MSDLRNEFAWSFSRHGTLEECPRRYYFRHHAFWGGWEPDADPRTRELYRLTKLEHRATWQGRVVHEAIAHALWQAREGRPIVEKEAVDDLLAGVLHAMRQDYADSRHDRARATGRFKQHVRFFEHEEGIDDGSPEWAARWKATADAVERGLRNFLGSRVHRKLCALAPDDWLELEDPRASVGPSFEVEGVKVHVRVDCAYRDGERAVLIDWKTGRRLSPAGPVQLGVYALYLQHRHGVDPAGIHAREINVVTGETREHDVGPEARATFLEVFRRSVETMRSYLVDVAGNVPKPEDDFPFARSEQTCRYCDFRSVCPRPSGP